MSLYMYYYDVTGMNDIIMQLYTHIMNTVNTIVPIHSPVLYYDGMHVCKKLLISIGP